MTVVAVVKDVCATVGVLVPASLFVNIGNNRTMQEMLALANEMAQRISGDTRDWTALKRTATMIGDGVLDVPSPPGDGLMHGTTAFNLPPDFRRIPVASNVWRSTSKNTPMRFIPNTDEWVRRRSANEVEGGGEWTLLGGQMHIYPVMAIGETASFVYLSRNAVALAAGGFGDVFQTDNDRFALDERLLRLGMIWQWKAQKGSPYAEEMGTFSDALAMAMGADSPAPIIVGRWPIDASISVVNIGQIGPPA